MECLVTLIISHFLPQMKWSASCAYGGSLKNVGALGWSLQDVLSLIHVHLFVSEFKMWYIWVKKTRFLCRLPLFQLRSKRCQNMLFEQTCLEAEGFLYWSEKLRVTKLKWKSQNGVEEGIIIFCRWHVWAAFGFGSCTNAACSCCW